MQKLSFKPFNEAEPVRIYHHGFLPHLRQAGCTYFVTFRLADSIPQAVLKQWVYERDKWLQARGVEVVGGDMVLALEQLQEKDRKQFERFFASSFFDYLDRGYGDCVLKRPTIAKLLQEALLFFHGSRLSMGDFAIMPNHVHALITPLAEYELEDLLQSLKSYSSTEINRSLETTGSLWMREYHDRLVRDGDELLRTQAYIRSNPNKAGLRRGEYVVREAEYELKTS